MQRDAQPFDAQALKLRTRISNSRAKETIRYAENLALDPERTARLKAGKCKVCFYERGRIAGQAFTQQPCACCSEPQTYSSTNTDALCLPCAQEHSLCKHCSGDLDSNLNRTNWPEPKE